ncbi:hypothetical protein Pcinc_011423 [Petrolisthes cinctipes]|uniref:Uncharacterized protein n=1 Tax=Petrolisthes cinctipes TaxID=88211 RepID=A0AAE1G1B5_PETCI|nr:hypothetical protein Pcinc_011423 [Petrolisthes cinctipes]
MPEHQARMDGYLNNSTLALEIKNASFAWENVNTDFTEEKTSAEKKQLVVDGKNKANKKNIHHNYSHLSSINLEPPAVEGSPNQPIHFIDTLFNIDLRVTSGKLVGVCGNIGSGKSSLLSAIAGDMKKLEGRVLINGDLSLVPQRAWIYNSTLRENILVGGRLDPLRYNDVIWACSLQDDFDLMHNGDMTEVGDRGVNLSGGQKQRVNVARAVYGDGDVFLLDDPLSALDTKVARHIFTNCIKGLLAQKTIILVTHTVHLLKQCDEIIVMESGRITETGTHRELMTRKGEYYSIVNRDEEDTDKEETGKDEEEERGGRRRRRRKRRGEDERELALSGEGRLTTEEKRRSGGVSWKVYRTIVQMCGGWGTASLILLSIVLFTVAKIFTSVWMKVWLDQGDGKMEERQRNKTHHNASMTEEELNGDISKNPDLWMYQMVYGLCYLCVFITGIVKSFSLPFWMLRGAGRLHSAMFDSIIRAPMRFFDTNPPGRIVNRFSRDLDDLDVRVPYFMGLLLTGLILTAGQFILVSCIYVWFIIPLAIIIALFILTDLFMNAGVRELKRLDNILRSPVTQHIVSTITGLSLIRTLKKQHLFRNRMYNYIDKHLASVLLYQQSNVWFVYRMNIISFMATLTITIICVFTKGIVSMASAGLAISSLNRVCSILPFLMKRKADIMSRLTSVERIIEYAFEVESEAALETPYCTKPLLLNNWPSKGGIELMGVTLIYRPDLPPVLHGITASIKPAHKIGIVGRTGAGKSSLMCALLRLCELDSGKILVDGVDISTLALHTLRSNLSVIPQDPVLFQGTLRYNLDPFGEYTDLAVWEALEQAHLRDVISCQDNGLMSKVEAAGKNFSVGERQLICLTRALLRSSKILMLDEATASVDQETDRVIQATIRQAFNTSTVLTIAHRLNTVAIYDKIMVLEAGQIVEFGSPVELMQRQTSVFREMMVAMGVKSVDQLKALRI